MYLFADKEYINAVDVYITNRYLEGTFNSCNKVSLPSTGLLALDLMCGDWGASRCTAVKWFHYMGDAATNPYVPFQITYMNTDVPVKSFEPLDPQVTPCSKPLNVSNCSSKEPRIQYVCALKMPHVYLGCFHKTIRLINGMKPSINA